MMKNPITSGTLAALGCALTLAAANAQQYTQEQIKKQRALFTEAQADLTRGEFELAEAKARALVKARPADPYMRKLLVRVQRAKLADSAHTPWKKKLESLRVPSVNIDGATLEEVVSFVRAKAKELSGDEAGPNIIVRGGTEVRDRPVSLKLSGVPLAEVLRYAGTMTGVRFEYEKHAIVGTNIRVDTPAVAKDAPAPEPPAAEPTPATPATPATKGEGFPAVIGFPSAGPNANAGF